MTKIAIISQAEQGVLIDISGCSSLTEAKQYLTSTLQVSSQFWEGLIVDLNLGPLVLTPEQVNEIQAIVSEVGVQPRQIFSLSPITRASLIQCRMPIGLTGQPAYTINKTVEGKQEIAAGADNVIAGSASTILKERAVSPFDGIGFDTTDGNLPAASLPSSAPFSTDDMGLPVAVPSLSLSTEAASILEVSAPTAAQPQAVKIMPPAVPAARLPQTPLVLMMKQTLRSGQRVSHKGHLVIIGDVNPGAELVADGDITVWGALRGMAHAGASGNTNAEIRALKFEPIQLRIAQAIARSPDRSKPGSNMPSGPETARVVDGKIRISGSEPE